MSMLKSLLLFKYLIFLKLNYFIIIESVIESCQFRLKSKVLDTLNIFILLEQVIEEIYEKEIVKSR